MSLRLRVLDSLGASGGDDGDDKDGALIKTVDGGYNSGRRGPPRCFSSALCRLCSPAGCANAALCTAARAPARGGARHAQPHTHAHGRAPCSLRTQANPRTNSSARARARRTRSSYYLKTASAAQCRAMVEALRGASDEARQAAEALSRMQRIQARAPAPPTGMPESARFPAGWRCPTDRSPCFLGVSVRVDECVRVGLLCLFRPVYLCLPRTCPGLAPLPHVTGSGVKTGSSPSLLFLLYALALPPSHPANLITFPTLPDPCL